MSQGVVRYKVAATFKSINGAAYVKNIKLDQHKLLGFKILQQTPKIGDKPVIKSAGKTLRVKIGAKPGVKPWTKPSGMPGAKIGRKPVIRLSAKIGVKIGLKPF